MSDTKNGGGESDSATTEDVGADAEETMQERVDRNTVLTYLLVEADRGLVTVGLFGALLGAFLLAGVYLPGAAPFVRSSDTIGTLFQPLASATVTGVTLVLTLNQLVLSQELGAVGDQRERMSGAIDFRTDVGEYLEDPVPPAEPSAFLRAMVTAVDARAGRLMDRIDAEEDTDDETDDEAEARQGVRDLAKGMSTAADRVSDSLSGKTFGEFAVVDEVLNFEYSRKLYRTRRLREEYGDHLSGEVCETLDELDELLRLFGPAREHFKTLYFQSELVGLSRTVLVAAVPSLAVAVSVLAFFEPSFVPKTSPLGFDPIVLVIGAAAAVALVPFLVLLSFVLRIATITGQTLSIGPFILRETEREGTTETTD